MMQKTVLTLISNPENAVLSKLHLAEASERLAELGADNMEINWLASDTACDLSFEMNQAALPEMQQTVASFASACSLDFALLPAENRRKKLLISDMDSTMIGQECIDELADAIGIGEKVAAITEAAMEGELDFAEALTERIALLKGLKESQLEAIYHARITPNAGAKTLVQTMKAHGAYALLVSGGFTFFTGKIAALLGFDADEANRLDFEDGALTGKVVHPILDKDSKLESLNRHCQTLNLTPADVVAVGDGANDLPMIEAAGLGIAYRGKQVVCHRADAAVNFTDLTSLLYMQGYRKNEFVS